MERLQSLYHQDSKEVKGNMVDFDGMSKKPESDFGSLIKIDPTTIWGDERNFSSWLIEHFSLLSEEMLNLN